MQSQSLFLRPLKLKPARVRRNYSGGLLLEQWQNKTDPRDGNMPENWVASTVDARNDDYVANEGLSTVIIGSDTEIFLRDLINESPEEFLGKEHTLRHSTNLGILVKLIDSCIRLYIQVHPDWDFAKRFFNSDFGKTEAWYVLGGRRINGEEPYVYFGFKEGITKKIWKELFEKQDIEGMLNCLHRFSVKAGDVFLIESGMPHAIGAGCFVLEAQEPTDFTFRVERTSHEGRKLPDTFCHQGIGFDNMLESFRYDGFSRDDILKHFYLKPSVIESQNGGTKSSIIPDRYSDFFTMEELNVNKKFYMKKYEGFFIAVVISGQGRIKWDGGEMRIEQSDELFFPAALNDFTWESDDEKDLKVVLCYPPKFKEV
ncbi:MAG: mannose-6-phosphate isomerase [Clostridiaceae bacterium]|nr:mannose-6-phosphate isomerase [Clostridiaceae bacterium]